MSVLSELKARMEAKGKFLEAVKEEVCDMIEAGEEGLVKARVDRKALVNVDRGPTYIFAGLCMVASAVHRLADEVARLNDR
jgi:hypothetical protein